MTRKQWIAKLLLALVGVLIAPFFIDDVGGAGGWALAGMTLAPTCFPLFRSLHAWSTERAIRAGKRNKG